MTSSVRSFWETIRQYGGIAVFAIFVSLSAKGLIAANGAAAAKITTYTLTDLGPLPQVPDDVAMRINNKGQVSLWVPAASFSVNAGVWTGTKIQRLGRVTGYPTSLSRAVNAGGQVAGWISTSLNPVDSEATVRAVVFSHGIPRVLGTLGGRNSQAFGVNAQGQTVGIADLAGGLRHAFVEDGKKMTDLGTLPDGVFSQAYAVNAAGNVVGMADSKGDRHAVEWRQGRIHDLGTLPGGGSSCAMAINDKDQVVGYSASRDGYHAFLYANGKMQDLGTLKEDPSSASDINIHGDVVGVSSVGNLERHAFLWHKGHLYDLNALTLSARASGWDLVSADAINDRGQIACVGIQKDGPLKAVLLTPRP